MPVTVHVGEVMPAAVPVSASSSPAFTVAVGEKIYIKGEPGFSPTIEIEGLPNGHRVTITDLAGPHSFDILNGDAGSYSAGEGISIEEDTISNTGVIGIRMNGASKGAGDVDLGTVLTQHQTTEDLGINVANNSDINNLFSI